MASTKKPGDTKKNARPGTGQPTRPGAGKPTTPGATTPPKQKTPAAAPIPEKKAPTAAYGPYVGETYRYGVTTGMGSRAVVLPTYVSDQPTDIVPGVTPTGTTGGGGSAVVQSPSIFETPQQYANWEEAAKELYGGYYSIIQSVPELQSLLRTAYEQKWSESRFEYEVKQTTWWKQNSATARQWDLQSQTDPASAEQLINSRIADMRNTALSEYQVDISEDRLRKLAADSLRGNWTDQMVKNAIGIEATRTGQGLSNLASGFVGQRIQQTANLYGLKLSEDMLNRWVGSIASGQETEQRFQQYAMNTAKTLFPAIATQLDSGLTVKDVTDPFRDVASQILEINRESIDFTDPKWARAISTVDKNGQQRMMSFSEWGDYLRTDRSFGYEYTSDAQQRAYKVANDLANLFGKV